MPSKYTLSYIHIRHLVISLLGGEKASSCQFTSPVGIHNSVALTITEGKYCKIFFQVLQIFVLKEIGF